MDTPDYVVIGHVTRDLVAGGYRLGGTVTYAAMTARALGYSVGILTSAADDLPLEPTFAGVELCVVPAADSTAFENIYCNGSRVQYLRSRAGHLTANDLPEAWRSARIAHLGPLAQEVALDLVDCFGAETLVGVTPQGWLRCWDEAGLVGHRPWTDAKRVLARADAMVFSLEDVGGDQAQLEAYLRMARLAVVTQSWQGAVLHHMGEVAEFPAYHVREVDPTGAGDVFAASFFVRLAESGDPYEAARFANAAASFAVEGEGFGAVASREAIERRLRNGVLRRR